MLTILLACADPVGEKPYSKFKDVANPELVVNAGATPGDGEKLQVFVHPQLAGVCRPLPELRADVDGVPLSRLHGRFQEGKIAYDRDCNVYEFAADAATLAKRPPGADAKVTVTDGETVVSVQAKNLFGERRLSAPAAALSPGAPVLLTWSPGGDRVLSEVKPSLKLTWDGGGETIAALDVTDDAIGFTLPATAHGAVQAELLGTAAFQPSTTACTGARACTVSRAYVVPPVTLNVR